MRPIILAAAALLAAPLHAAPLTPAAAGYERFALGTVRVAAQPGAGWLFAAGQLAMTATDLAKWDIAVIDRRVLKPASYAVQQTDVTLTDATATGYGLGVDVGKAGTHRMIAHGGAAFGFLTENRIYSPRPFR